MESPRGDSTALGDEAIAVRGCSIETPALRSVLEVVGAPRIGWTAPTTSVVAGGAAVTLSASGPERFGRLRTEADDLFERVRTPESLPDGARPRLFGGFSFTADSSAEGPWRGYPDAWFTLPAIQVSITSDGTWLTTAAIGPDADEAASERLDRWRDRIASLPVFEPGAPPGVESRRHTPELPEWREAVESVVDRIGDGDLRKVVLAQSLSADLAREPRVVDILARLGKSYPGCYQFLFEPEDSPSFLGATPERLVKMRGRTVDTEALAGSIGRGETKDEDDWLEAQIRDSEKNNHEHGLVVDAVCDQLAAMTTDIETGDRTVRKLSNVQHLQTPIRATLDDDRHVLELVEQLHPTPAVGGLPPEAARQTIRDLGGFDRGWYAAPVGWIDEHGDGTFLVAIRSAVTDNTTATMFAGAGIVDDSDPDEEYDEIQLKFRPILDELT
ncbi:isochorismate synthase [Halovenus salina]|uniref:isochorismate synthase n=1 Tax=Halovenus salina TaxID=1510225 RepID=UPI00226091FE|nr:isochorismate synthase [Halovenus salina]